MQGQEPQPKSRSTRYIVHRTQESHKVKTFITSNQPNISYGPKYAKKLDLRPNNRQYRNLKTYTWSRD